MSVTTAAWATSAVPLGLVWLIYSEYGGGKIGITVNNPNWTRGIKSRDSSLVDIIAISRQAAREMPSFKRLFFAPKIRCFEKATESNENRIETNIHYS